MKFIKCFLVVLFAFSGFYFGLFLYHYRQKDAKTKTESQEIRKQISAHLTEEFWKNVTFSQLKEKLQSIKNVNKVRPNDGKNMLHLLVMQGNHPEMVSLLVNKGVNFKLKDKKNKAKALHYSVIRKEKSLEFTKEILKYDTDVNEIGGKKGTTALMWAVHFRSPIEVIKLLLEQGADPHFQSKTGSDVLMSASAPNELTGNQFINPKAIQLILDHKIDIKIKNSDGKTAYDYMKENKEFIKTKLFKKISEKFQSNSNN